MAEHHNDSHLNREDWLFFVFMFLANLATFYLMFELFVF